MILSGGCCYEHQIKLLPVSVLELREFIEVHIFLGSLRNELDLFSMILNFPILWILQYVRFSSDVLSYKVDLMGFSINSCQNIFLLMVAGPQVLFSNGSLLYGLNLLGELCCNEDYNKLQQGTIRKCLAIFN